MTVLTIRVTDPCELAVLAAHPSRHLLPSLAAEAIEQAHQDLRRQAVLAARQEDLDAVEIRSAPGDLLRRWPVAG
jgi:phage gp29-like protein